MNPKVLALGSLIIVLLFGGGMWYLLQYRQHQLQQTFTAQQPNNTTYTFNENEVTEQMKIAANKEFVSTQLLLRGTVVSANQQTATISLLTKSLFEKNNPTEELVELPIGQITQIKCWPSTIPTQNGPSIDVRDSYFEVNENSHLSLNAETTQDLASIWSKLSGKFAFVLLTRPYTSANNQPPVKELAILDC